MSERLIKSLAIPVRDNGRLSSVVGRAQGMESGFKSCLGRRVNQIYLALNLITVGQGAKDRTVF